MEPFHRDLLATVFPSHRPLSSVFLGTLTETAFGLATLDAEHLSRGCSQEVFRLCSLSPLATAHRPQTNCCKWIYSSLTLLVPVPKSTNHHGDSCQDRKVQDVFFPGKNVQWFRRALLVF